MGHNRSLLSVISFRESASCHEVVAHCSIQNHLDEREDDTGELWLKMMSTCKLIGLMLQVSVLNLGDAFKLTSENIFSAYHLC